MLTIKSKPQTESSVVEATSFLCDPLVNGTNPVSVDMDCCGELDSVQAEKDLSQEETEFWTSFVL